MKELRLSVWRTQWGAQSQIVRIARRSASSVKPDDSTPMLWGSTEATGPTWGAQVSPTPDEPDL